MENNDHYCGWAHTYYRLWPHCTQQNGYCEYNSQWYNTALWPIIIVGILTYLIWTEYGSQDCQYQNCNNTSKVIYATDSITETIDKTTYNIRKNHTIIGWRRALLVSIVAAIIILMIFCPYFPHGFTIFLTILIIFVIVYFAQAWFQARWWKPRDRIIEKMLFRLRV